MDLLVPEAISLILRAMTVLIKAECMLLCHLLADRKAL